MPYMVLDISDDTVYCKFLMQGNNWLTSLSSLTLLSVKLTKKVENSVTSERDWENSAEFDQELSATFCVTLVLFICIFYWVSKT